MKKILLLASLCVTSITFAQKFEGSVTLGNNDEMEVMISLDQSTSKATFTVTGDTASWFGLGVGTTNMQGYAIMHNVVDKANGDAREYKMSGNTAPAEQASQDLSQTSKTVNGSKVTFVYTRDFDTSDGDDYTFDVTKLTIPLSYAIANGNTFDYHGNGNRGASQIVLKNIGLDEINNQFEILINTDFASISENTDANWNVFDMTGKNVLEVRNANQISFSNLKTGFYILKADVQGTINTRKLYIQ